MLSVVGVEWKTYHSGTSNQNPTSPNLLVATVASPREGGLLMPANQDYPVSPASLAVYGDHVIQFWPVMEEVVCLGASGKTNHLSCFWTWIWRLELQISTKKKKGHKNHRNPNYTKPKLLKSTLFIMGEK